MPWWRRAATWEVGESWCFLRYEHMRSTRLLGFWLGGRKRQRALESLLSVGGWVRVSRDDDGDEERVELWVPLVARNGGLGRGAEAFVDWKRTV